jgi:uncharacterized protein YgiM (DUF1202 family)
MTVRRAISSTLLLLGGLMAATPAPAAVPPRAVLGADTAIVQVQAGGTATVRTSYANLRAEPSTGSAKLGRLNHGAKLEVLGTSGDWVQVKSGDKTGYVNSKLLTR